MSTHLKRKHEDSQDKKMKKRRAQKTIKEQAKETPNDTIVTPAKDAKDSKETFTLALNRLVFVPDQAIVKSFTEFVHMIKTDEDLNWENLLKQFKLQCESKDFCDGACESRWLRKLRSKWCWSGVTANHMQLLVNEHPGLDFVVTSKVLQDDLVSRIWKNHRYIDSNEMMRCIWEDGFAEKAGDWPSKHSRLVDCNLTEVLSFYVAWRGSYGIDSLYVFAWIFTHCYGEYGLFWFLYVTLAGMAVKLPAEHLRWKEDVVSMSLETGLSCLLSMEKDCRHFHYLKSVMDEFTK